MEQGGSVVLHDASSTSTFQNCFHDFGRGRDASTRLQPESNHNPKEQFRLPGTVTESDEPTIFTLIWQEMT
jgi:hypothetical protein